MYRLKAGMRIILLPLTRCFSYEFVYEFLPSTPALRTNIYVIREVVSEGGVADAS